MDYKPAMLLCPWDSLGKNTRMCCHFLLQGRSFCRRDQAHISCIGRGVLYHCAIVGAYYTSSVSSISSFHVNFVIQGFPGGLDGKESACNAGDPGMLPWLVRSPREGNDNPLQYSCLENSMDRGAW